MEKKREMTLEQKATKADTFAHIAQVAILLYYFQTQLGNRALLHDQSKLTAPELETFTKFTPLLAGSTYGSDEYRRFLREMKPALDNHYAVNRHHPEHFAGGIDDMTLIDLIEMLCDWMAAAERHDDGDIINSIKINRTRFGISKQLTRILNNTVKALAMWTDEE